MPIIKYFIKLKTILNTDILMLGLRTKCTYNLANYWPEFVKFDLSLIKIRKKWREYFH